MSEYGKVSRRAFFGLVAKGAAALGLAQAPPAGAAPAAQPPKETWYMGGAMPTSAPKALRPTPRGAPPADQWTPCADREVRVYEGSDDGGRLLGTTTEVQACTMLGRFRAQVPVVAEGRAKWLTLCVASDGRVLLDGPLDAKGFWLQPDDTLVVDVTVRPEQWL